MRTRRDFDRAFKEGRRGSAESLSLVVAPAPGELSRLGLAVSRKVGNAVHRNRVRRLLRECFRRLAPATPALDIVAVPRPGIPVELEPLMRLFELALQRGRQPRGRRSRPRRGGARS